MGTVLLIRHGQASIHAAEYDQLSPRGEEQSRLLGAHLARSGSAPDAVFTGPRVRQRRTAELAREAAAAAGVPWPEVQTLAELDEMQVQSVIRTALPGMAAAEPAIAALVAALSTAEDERARARAFEHLFQAVLLRWSAGAVDAPGVEPWAAFCERAARALEVLRAASAGGRHVAAFTSAGPIAVAAGRAMGVREERVVELAFMVRNTGILELLTSRDRLTLVSFNGVPQLVGAAPALLTYR